MKLIKAQVTNFRSVEDSTEFEIGNLTCFVGKNEAGKTSLLSALRGLNPTQGGGFEKTRDYPRAHLTKFESRHPSGDSEVIKTWWVLSSEDKVVVEKTLGIDTLPKIDFCASYGIGYDTRIWTLEVDHVKCLLHLKTKHTLTEEEWLIISQCKQTADAHKILKDIPAKSASQIALFNEIESFRKQSATLKAVDLLYPRMPKFFYTSHFERMAGKVSVNELKVLRSQNKVLPPEQIFLDFLEYAGTDLNELSDAKEYEAFKAQCEAASAAITDEMFEFWTQNTALEIEIEFYEGRAKDVPPFNSGPIAEIRIKNTIHRASVTLSERSAGFVWFFSFLAQFKLLQKRHPGAILLLDEPGLTLHGKAQADLLRFIEERLLPEHQVIFTTHSPFMVPSQRLADVRIVEDVVKKVNNRQVVEGTKVFSDVLKVGKDTLFPLQAQLGYDITQTLFIGKNTLLVEGPGDVVLLKVLSQAMLKHNREQLNPTWTICPAGGLDKVGSFLSLFSGNNLNLAILTDFGADDKKKVEALRQRQILETSRILTTSDFTNKPESDIEDLIHPSIYCELVNHAFNVPGSHTVTPTKLAAQTSPRLVKQATALFAVMPPSVAQFDHYAPAEWLMRNPSLLDKATPEVVATLDAFESVFKKLNSFLK